jgi:hypothetical protein
MTKEYHNDLALYAEVNLPKIYATWKKSMRVDPFLLSWPSELVYDVNGVPLENVCYLDLPQDKNQWRKMMHEALKLTSPKALLLLEQNDKDVKLILETPAGSTSWVIPIERHGDICVLGKAAKKTDTDSIGLLWRPNIAEA